MSTAGEREWSVGNVEDETRTAAREKISPEELIVTKGPMKGKNISFSLDDLTNRLHFTFRAGGEPVPICFWFFFSLIVQISACWIVLVLNNQVNKHTRSYLKCVHLSQSEQNEGIFCILCFNRSILIQWKDALSSANFSSGERQISSWMTVDTASLCGPRVSWVHTNIYNGIQKISVCTRTHELKTCWALMVWPLLQYVINNYYLLTERVCFFLHLDVLYWGAEKHDILQCQFLQPVKPFASSYA